MKHPCSKDCPKRKALCQVGCPELEAYDAATKEEKEAKHKKRCYDVAAERHIHNAIQRRLKKRRRANKKERWW